jgi:hypothetical protein
MKTLVIAVCILALAGCASLKYETADGTKVTYSRLFTTADSIEGTVGTAKIKVGGQKIDASTLNALLGILGAAAK